MSEVGLERARVSTGVRLVEPTGMPKHVGVDLDLEPSSLASSVDELLEVADGHRRAAFGQKQKRRLAFSLAVQAT